MSKSDSKPKVSQLREGYQGASRENRGHQVALDKGYQPKAQISVLQPPPVGTTTVVPVKNGASNSTHSGNGAKN